MSVLMNPLKTELSLPGLRVTSSSPSLLDPLSRDSLQKTMSLTQRESVWILTHSPRANQAFFYPSPSSSAFEVPIEVSRPVTSGISSLTHRENEKLERRLATVDSHPARGQVRTAAAAFSLEDRLITTPSDRDFKRVLARLEKITSSQGAAIGRVTIKEGKTYDTTLDEGDRQTFKVVTKSQQCPLRIYVKRSGKTVIFASRTVMEPSETIYDVTTKGEKMTVSDPGLKFRSENIYFTIIALEDLRITVWIGFGREIQESGGKLTVRKRVIHRDDTLKALDEIKKDENKLQQLYRRVEVIERERKEAAMVRSQAKNFLTINKTVSPPRPGVYTERLHQLAERTSIAKTVRAQHIEAKKERALAMIYRREQLQEEARQRRLEAESTRKQELQERNLLTVLFLGLSFEGLYRTFVDGKLRYVEAQRKALAAKLIQRQLRKWFWRMDRKGLALLISRSALWVFAKHCGALIRTATEHRVKRCIEESRTNHKLPSVIRTFYGRMSLIVAVWRQFRDRLRKQWAELNNAWDAGLEHIKKAGTGKKSTGKKAKGAKKKEDAMAFYNISAGTKKMVLTNYLAEEKRRYRAKVKQYLEGTKLLRQIGAEAFQMRYASLDDDEFRSVTAAPDFSALPTVEEMVKLIESAVAASS